MRPVTHNLRLFLNCRCMIVYIYIYIYIDVIWLIVGYRKMNTRKDHTEIQTLEQRPFFFPKVN